MGRGKFIVLEGIDGAGKSTLAANLKADFEAKGHKVVTTFEPTKGPIGSIIRDVLTHRMVMDEKTIAALFLADRLHHIQNEEDGILNYLNEGIHVICDRYYLSSYAYHVPYVSLDWVIKANEICAQILKPDIICFIDISVKESLKRIANNRVGSELYETEDRLNTVRKNYLKAIDEVEKSENICIIDGALSKDKVFSEVLNAVESIL